MRVAVDEDKCCGAGQCVLAAPGVFDQRDDDGIVILMTPRPEAGQIARVRQAAEACPGWAITIDEVESR